MGIATSVRHAKAFSGVAACLLLGTACAVMNSGASQDAPAGLWDAHTHLTWWGPDALDSLDKYGIVGVRDLGSDAVFLAKWRDEIAQGKRRGPRIFFAGGQIDGPKDNTQWRTIVTTEAEARRAVDSLAGLGVSFIKVHNKLRPDLFFVVLREARRHHLPVAAHLPEGVAAWTAADSGVASLEHMAESIMISPMYAGVAKTLRESIDWWLTPAGDTMIAHLARTGVAVTPTLAAYQEFAREKGASEQSRAAGSGRSSSRNSSRGGSTGPGSRSLPAPILPTRTGPSFPAELCTKKSGSSKNRGSPVRLHAGLPRRTSRNGSDGGPDGASPAGNPIGGACVLSQEAVRGALTRSTSTLDSEEMEDENRATRCPLGPGNSLREHSTGSSPG